MPHAVRQRPASVLEPAAIGLLSPAALLLDGWASLRHRWSGGDGNPGRLELCALVGGIAAVYVVCFGELARTMVQVAVVERMPMIDSGVITITIGGSLARHVVEILRCCASLGFLGLSMGFRLLHLAAVVALRTPGACLLTGCLCAFGQRGLW